jgi:hypothetical protein
MPYSIDPKVNAVLARLSRLQGLVRPTATIYEAEVSANEHSQGDLLDTCVKRITSFSRIISWLDAPDAPWIEVIHRLHFRGRHKSTI